MSIQLSLVQNATYASTTTRPFLRRHGAAPSSACTFTSRACSSPKSRAPAQLTFINDSLSELRDSLRRIGGDLTLRVGEMPGGAREASHRPALCPPLGRMRKRGTYETYQRDRRVRAWAKDRGIPFTELPKDGVVRCLATRDDWARQWRARMRAAACILTRVSSIARARARPPPAASRLRPGTRPTSRPDGR